MSPVFQERSKVFTKGTTQVQRADLNISMDDFSSLASALSILILAIAVARGIWRQS